MALTKIDILVQSSHWLLFDYKSLSDNKVFPNFSIYWRFEKQRARPPQYTATNPPTHTHKLTLPSSFQIKTEITREPAVAVAGDQSLEGQSFC